MSTWTRSTCRSSCGGGRSCAGLPVIVAGTGPRAVVTTASYEARRFGVGSAMPAARARRLCPDGVYLPPDFAYYREASREVMALVRACSDAGRGDRARRGLPGPHGPAGAARGDAAAACTRSPSRPGWTARSGSAPTSWWPRSPPMPRSRAGSSSSPASRPASASPQSPCGLIPGIGPKTAERLQRSGLDTLGKLAAAPPEQLAARFGARFGAALQSRARFEDDSPVTEERKVISESRETTFDYDIADPAALERGPGAARRAAVRGAGPPAAPRPDDRDQGPPRRLLHPHPGPHAGRAGGVAGPGAAGGAGPAAALCRRRGRCGCWGCGWPGSSRRRRRTPSSSRWPSR